METGLPVPTHRGPAKPWHCALLATALAPALHLGCALSAEDASATASHSRTKSTQHFALVATYVDCFVAKIPGIEEALSTGFTLEPGETIPPTEALVPLFQNADAIWVPLVLVHGGRPQNATRSDNVTLFLDQARRIHDKVKSGDLAAAALKFVEASTPAFSGQDVPLPMYNDLTMRTQSVCSKGINQRRLVYSGPNLATLGEDTDEHWLWSDRHLARIALDRFALRPGAQVDGQILHETQQFATATIAGSLSDYPPKDRALAAFSRVKPWTSSQTALDGLTATLAELEQRDASVQLEKFGNARQGRLLWHGNRLRSHAAAIRQLPKGKQHWQLVDDPYANSYRTSDSHFTVIRWQPPLDAQ